MQLSRRDLNRTLLERQLLLERSSRPVADVIEHLVGMQSQTPVSPYIALWARLADFRPEQLGDLIGDREAVRIALQRSTIHLVSSADCLALRPVLQRVIDTSLGANFRRALAGVDAVRLEAAGRALVDEAPRTFAELGPLLAEIWPDHDPQALAMGVRAAVALVQVPPRGVWGKSGAARHTSAEAWLGRPLATGVAEGDLVLRYLRAFGPASVRDVQVWSGLTRLRGVVERLRPQLRSFTDEHGAELVDVVDAPLADSDRAAPVRLLPDYDNLLLSHADRSRVIAAEHRPLIFAGNGVHPTVLIDGFVAGRWRLTRAGGTATIAVEPFGKLRTSDRVAVEDEATRLLRRTDPDSTNHEVVFSDPRTRAPRP
jgi:hypothetical protein